MSKQIKPQHTIIDRLLLVLLIFSIILFLVSGYRLLALALLHDPPTLIGTDVSHLDSRNRGWAMSTTTPAIEEKVSTDTYLGFKIVPFGLGFLARPYGWPGGDLQANDLPTLRKKIWAWWHHV